MKLIISPTKQMTQDETTFLPVTRPHFLAFTEQILNALLPLSYDEAKALWKCNDKLAEENFQRIHATDLTKGQSAAILSYKGLQYQYMAPDLLTEPALHYLQDHLRILSGFYGVLRPFDGISPYRLEMQAPLAVGEAPNLYRFWGDRLYQDLFAENEPVINLASKEYSKALTPYLQENDQLIDIDFIHLIDGKRKVKATLAKMARGEMVRYLAEQQVTTLAGIKAFPHPHYRFSQELSTDTSFVFLFHD